MIKRSVHHASYSMYRIRGAALLCLMAGAGVGIGAVMASADLVLIGAIGLGSLSEAGSSSDSLMALGVTLGMAALAVGVAIWMADRCAPLMRRTREDDRLNSRWGLRWVSISFALVPFIFVAVALALMALGFDFNS